MPKQQKNIKSLDLSIEDIRLKMKNLGLSTDPSIIYRKFYEEYISKVGNKDFNSANVDSTLINQAMLLGNFENHFLLSQSAGEEVQPLAIQFARDLIEEYDCRKVSEIAVVHMVVESYVRVLNLSKKLKCNFPKESYSDLTIVFLNQLGKELDRAHRHFNVAIQTLKQIKNPIINVKVNTNTAFLANNQQNLNSDILTKKINDRQ